MVTLIRAATSDIKNACIPAFHPGAELFCVRRPGDILYPEPTNFFYLHSLIKKDNEVSENGS